MKVAIAGLGNIGQKHIEALSRIDDFSLVAVCDPLSGIDIPGVTKYPNIDEILTHHQPDILSVCTPNYLHPEHTMLGLEAGCHVICEKPLATDGASCQRMIESAEKNNKHIFCVMQNRFAPVSQWLKSAIQEEKLGKVFMINVAAYWNRNDAYYLDSPWRGKTTADGGTLFTQFSHYIDMLYWLFGDLNIQGALFDNFTHNKTVEFEDSSIFNFTTKDGALGTFAYTTSVYRRNFESTLTIIGEKGSIKISGQYMNEIEHCDAAGINITGIGASDNIENLATVYRNARDVIVNGHKPVIDVRDGLNVVSIIENVYRFKKT